jgi:hypothetical protein
MKTNIAEGFHKEFEAYRSCLANTIRSLSDDDWTKGKEPRAMPVHQVCHMISVIARYAHSTSNYSGILFGWKPQPKYPSRRDLLKLIDGIWKDVASYINDVAARTLMERDWSVPPLPKLVYLFRHSVWHLACLGEELRARGLRMPSYLHSLRRKRS